jgi:hypothetical protein
MMPQRLWMVGLSSLLAAACSSSPGTQPNLAPCTASSSGQVNLGVAAYMAVDPTQTAGCAVFPANPSAATIEYLVVPQSASSIPDDSGAFKLGGNPLAAPPVPGAPLAAAVPLGTAQQFDLTLRLAERQLAAQGPPLRRAAPVAPRVIVPGTSRTFKVCGDLTCSTHPTVTATAKSVGQHVAVYVDNAAPDTLTTGALDSLAAVFDTVLYPSDTAAFGRESDIDGNGLVIVVMTAKVNSLVTSAQCLSPTGGYVAGYFYGGDLIIGFSGGNSAEVFFSMVPDSLATISCMHSRSAVKRIVPVTFVHEFQHMISFGQHYLQRAGNPEDLWLNEALSHYAEENGGRRFLPDTTIFCDYVFGDLYNAGQYFSAPQNHFLVDTAGIGGLAERGAYWLFVRYLVDRYAADTTRAAADAFTRSLEATTLTGAANVVARTGTSFPILVGHWALASFVADLSGFSSPPELQYVKWQFRSAFPLFNSRCSNRIPAQFPLIPAVVNGGSAQLAGMLRAGSGSYYRIQQVAGAPSFTLLFSNGGGGALRSTLVPRLNVIRIQ